MTILGCFGGTAILGKHPYNNITHGDLIFFANAEAVKHITSRIGPGNSQGKSENILMIYNPYDIYTNYPTNQATNHEFTSPTESPRNADFGFGLGAPKGILEVVLGVTPVWVVVSHHKSPKPRG